MTIYNTNTGITVRDQVSGEEIFISKELLDEIHRQENIQWGKDIIANYEEVLVKDLNEITDEEYEDFAKLLEEKMLSDNGDMETKALEEIFETYNGNL